MENAPQNTVRHIILKLKIIEYKKKSWKRSTRCSTTGLVVSLQCWGAGSILAQHSGLKDAALPWLQHKSRLHLGSDPWPGNSIWHGVAKKKSSDRSQRKNTFILYSETIKIKGIYCQYSCFVRNIKRSWEWKKRIKIRTQIYIKSIKGLSKGMITFS